MGAVVVVVCVGVVGDGAVRVLGRLHRILKNLHRAMSSRSSHCASTVGARRDLV